MPHHPRGTLTPLVPLSLRAFKGEGEKRIGAHSCAKRMSVPLIQYRGEGERKRGGDWAMSRGLVRCGGRGKGGEVGVWAMSCGLVRRGWGGGKEEGLGIERCRVA